MTAMDILQRDDLAFPDRFPSSSSSFPMTRRARLILNSPAGLTALPAGIAMQSASPSASSLGPAFLSAARAAAKPASWLAR
jgi:hypothetical protein